MNCAVADKCAWTNATVDTGMGFVLALNTCIGISSHNRQFYYCAKLYLMREVQPAWCVIAFLRLELLMAKAIALWRLHLLMTKAMPFQAGKCIWHCCLLKQQIVQYNIFSK